MFVQCGAPARGSRLRFYQTSTSSALTDDDGPGAQDEDALQVGALEHLSLQSVARAPARPRCGEPARGAGRVVGRGGNIGCGAAGGKAAR
jgi:hypothetical protein